MSLLMHQKSPTDGHSRPTLHLQTIGDLYVILGGDESERRADRWPDYTAAGQVEGLAGRATCRGASGGSRERRTVSVTWDNVAPVSPLRAMWFIEVLAVGGEPRQ